ncbi:MAG: hypothetical protein AAF551_11055, partial [Bacteroidota bacterium]
MKKPDFLFLLIGVSFVSFKLAKEFLKDDLKDEFRYDVELNASQDDPTLQQFDTYPKDNGKIELGLSDREVV